MKVKVRDVMTSDVVTIDADAPLKEAAVIMTKNRISGLPVLDRGKLVGIITESDFVARLAGSDEGIISVLFGRKEPEVTGKVGDAMSKDPYTIGPDDSVASAARRMAEKRVKRLPVVESDGRLVGVVSRADLMSVFARDDDRIRSDVVNDGVVQLLGVDREAVQVSVANGVVSLSGTVGSVTEKRMLEEFVKRMPGVVSVESDLDAAFDETRLPPM